MSTSDEACSNAEVSKHIQEVITETNKKVISRAAMIKKFKLLPTDFSVFGEEFTPTTKLRRTFTEKKFRKQVDEIYAVQAKM